MDDGQLSVAEQLAAAPRSSVEKLDLALAELAGARVDDAVSAAMLGMLRSMLPALRRMGAIPTDPAELDALALVGARWALLLRSDTAWQPETIDDLFLGPQTGQEPPEEG